MRLIFLLLLALAPALALAQSETCPRIWRSGDSLLTDPAPHLQWLRDGQPIPDANRSWYLPTQAGRYSVVVRGGLSTPFALSSEGGYVITGFVFDELHRPVAGATVRRGPFIATTDVRGRFVLMIDEEKPAAETPVVVRVEKAGYWRNASRQYISAFQTTETQIMLHTKRVTNRVDATAGGEMAYRGFSLQIPPDAVQTESGTPYNGTILLSVEGATPAEPDFGLRMPGGSFEAVDASGNDVLLYSYGYMSVEMATESGEKLELRPEARATLRFSLPYTETHRPDSVPLWHFNTETALWEQEGWSVRNGSIYEGQVSHFSAWNCDIPAERSTVRGRVVDCNNEPLKGGWVRVGQRQVVTDSLGTYWTFVPGEITFDAWATSDTLRNLTVPAQQERTLRDLTGIDFTGLAVWNPQTQTLNIHVLGNVPENLRLSTDGGQSWTAEREFAGVAQAPETVLLEGSACTDRLRVFTLPRPADCRLLDWQELRTATQYRSFEAALAAQNVVHRLRLQGNFGSRWDLLSAFPCLAELHLYENQLTELPASIGNLTNLQSLWLHENQLTELPASFGNLTNLQWLDLSQNQLRELPAFIGNLTKLQQLRLDRNQLTELPAFIGNLTNLQELGLNSNQLTELPSSITNLTNLEVLGLNSNQLTELPSSITNLTNLEVLGLNSNQLTELPESIGNLTNLQELYLNYNQLTELPESIGNLTNLQRLNLERNQLRELPASFGNLTNLQWLWLERNQLTELPASIGNLTNLQSLYLRGNQLTELPESIDNLTNLRELGLSFNQLTELPAFIGNLTNLGLLFLSGNQLTELPAFIDNLTNLQELWLDRNQLTELPASIGNLTNLQELRLDRNQLTELPASIGNLTNLQSLYLRGNQLIELPESIGNLTNLQTLGLDNNQLTELPASIGNLTNLQTLSLRGNPIPVERRAAIQALLPSTTISW